MDIAIETDCPVKRCAHCKAPGHTKEECQSNKGLWICSRKVGCECNLYINKRITVGNYFQSRPSGNFEYKIMKNPNYRPCTIVQDALAAGIDIKEIVSNYKLSDKTMSVTIDGEDIEFAYVPPKKPVRLRDRLREEAERAAETNPTHRQKKLLF